MAKESTETKKRLLTHVNGLDSIAAIVAIIAWAHGAPRPWSAMLSSLSITEIRL